MSVLTVADLKSHLNVDGTADDALIGAKIEAAEAFVGAFVGKKLTDFDPVPDDLKEAVRMLVGHLYENREASIAGIPTSTITPGLYELMAPHREWVF